MNQSIKNILNALCIVSLLMGTTWTHQAVTESDKLIIDNETINYAVVYSNPDPVIAKKVEDWGKEAVLVGDVVVGAASYKAYSALRKRAKNIQDEIAIQRAHLVNLKDSTRDDKTLKLVDDEGYPVKSKVANSKWKSFAKELEYLQKPMGKPRADRKVTLLVTQILDDGTIDADPYENISMKEAKAKMKKILSNGNNTAQINMYADVPMALDSHWADLESKDVKIRTNERLSNISKTKWKIRRLVAKRRFLNFFAKGAFAPILAASVAIGFFTATSTINFLQAVETLDAVCSDPAMLRMKAIGMAHEKLASTSDISLEEAGITNVGIHSTLDMESAIDLEQANIEDLCLEIEKND